MGHLITVSTLSGNSDSTSFLSRRNKKGLKTLCNRRIIKSCSSSVISIFSCPVAVAKGELNHSSKDLTELKILGRMKFKSAQSSGRLF